MKFKIQREYSGEESFTESNPPKWLSSREYKWFLDKYVLTLPINGSVETDFSTITRIE